MKLLLHPLPVRFFHWLMAITMTTLIFTGLYMNNPFLGKYIPMRMIHFIHSINGMILIANTLSQIYYYILTRKYTEVLFCPLDIANIRSLLRYYLFITDNHPNYGRYNPGQKGLFTIFWLLILIASIVGLALLFLDQIIGLQKIMPGLTTLRMIKYIIAMSLISAIILHLYLVFTESPARLQAMFTGYIKTSASSAKKLAK